VRAILNRFGKALIAGAATAAVIGMAAAPAFATAATWTVKPGGATTGTAGKTVITAKGTLKNGSGLAGAGLGSITSLAFKGCSILGQTPTVTITGKMPLNGISYNATTKTASMTITKIHGTISVSSLSCSATIDGTGATAHNGMVKATFSNVTNTLKVLASGNLHLYNNTCPVIANGDSVNFTGSYKLTPKQTITSP